MKRILKLLARLYPAAWHERYGTEFEALLEDRNPQLRDIFDILIEAMKMQFRSWSFVRITVACTILGALIAAALSFTLHTPLNSASSQTLSRSNSQPATRVPPSKAPSVPDGLKQLLSTLRSSTLDRDFLEGDLASSNTKRTSTPTNAPVCPSTPSSSTRCWTA